jgi:hypothetical protein
MATKTLNQPAPTSFPRGPNGRTPSVTRREMDAKQAERLRQVIIQAAETTLTVLAAAEESGEGEGDDNGELSRRLLVEAWAALKVWADSVRSAELTEDSAGWWRNDLVTIRSYIEGAAALATGTARGVILEGVKSTLKDMAEDLVGRYEFPERGAYYPQLFMSGVRQFADALEEIYRGGDSGWFEATDRGQDVSQKREAIEQRLNAFRYNAAALEGFTAALTAFIAPTRNSSWSDAVGYFRDVTYPDYAGEVRHG